jgi:hypothetical protein
LASVIVIPNCKLDSCTVSRINYCGAVMLLSPIFREVVLIS